MILMIYHCKINSNDAAQDLYGQDFNFGSWHTINHAFLRVKRGHINLFDFYVLSKYYLAMHTKEIMGSNFCEIKL